MDLTIKMNDGYFNYRVAAVIIHNNKLLVMYNQETDTYYLPGGRVKLHESSQTALKRELKEELSININHFRPLWFNENFFIEESIGEKFHELGVYYLVDIKDTEFNHFENTFILKENGRINHFKWIAFENLEDQIVYPLFLKDRISSLPAQLEMITEYEY